MLFRSGVPNGTVELNNLEATWESQLWELIPGDYADQYFIRNVWGNEGYLTHTGIDLGNDQWERSNSVELTDNWDANAQKWTLLIPEGKTPLQPTPDPNQPNGASGLEGAYHMMSSWREDNQDDLFLNRKSSPGQEVNTWTMEEDWESLQIGRASCRERV